MPIFYNLSENRNWKTNKHLSNSFYEVTFVLIPKLDKDNIRKENHRPISFINRDAKNSTK